MERISWVRLKPILMQGLGYTFLVLGVLGLFLPFLQGFLFLFVGLIILARHATWARRLLDHLRARSPRLNRAIDASERKLHAWGERVSAWFRRRPKEAASPAPARCACQPPASRRDPPAPGRGSC